MPETPFNHTCLYCHRAVTIEYSRYSFITALPDNVPGSLGSIGYAIQTIVCPNPNCNKEQVIVGEFTRKPGAYTNAPDRLNEQIEVYTIRPSSRGRAFPEYVPQVIVEDYDEACAIESLSPKASATLARRALQGILRNFYGVSGRTLFKEIEAVEKRGDVEPSLIEAIHSIREVGNIGAHMEGDVNTIVDIDPDEARILISLIELLIDETYIREHDRNERIAQATALAIKKRAERDAGPTT